MAYTDKAPCFSLDAGADLSSSQFTFVSINTSGQAVGTSAAAAPDGVVYNDPASGDAAEVAYAGLVQVTAGEAISQGDDVAVGTGGKARTATSGDAIVGRAVTAASGDGAVFTMHFLPRSVTAA